MGNEPLVQRRSWLSIQFIGIPSETLYHVVLTLALLSGVGIFFHQFETFLAKKWWRLREPSDPELKRMKSTTLGGRVLRAQHPAAVVQETWALLATYQVLRTAMTDAVLAHPDIDPDRASFTVALQAARDQIVRAAAIITGTTVDLVGRIGAAVLANLLPARRPRIRPRVIKRAISEYRAKEPDTDRRTRTATIKINIHPDGLTPKPND